MPSCSANAWSFFNSSSDMRTLKRWPRSVSVISEANVKPKASYVNLFIAVLRPCALAPRAYIYPAVTRRSSPSRPASPPCPLALAGWRPERPGYLTDPLTGDFWTLETAREVQSNRDRFAPLAARGWTITRGDRQGAPVDQ